MAEAHRQSLLVAVCGAGSADDELFQTALSVGRLLAESGAVLICGGLGGVMQAAAQGAKSAKGVTIGLLPGNRSQDANPYIDIPLATGLSHARNALITRAAHAVIALPGGPGTLSEVALALKMGRTVVGLNAWHDIIGVIPAYTPLEAVETVLKTPPIHP
jgi:uncharacterized protein (TIGR00725 family)